MGFIFMGVTMEFGTLVLHHSREGGYTLPPPPPPPIIECDKIDLRSYPLIVKEETTPSL